MRWILRSRQVASPLLRTQRIAARAYAPEMPGRYVAPRIDLSAFSCPHCGTLTSMYQSAARLRFPAVSDEEYVAARGLRITTRWSCGDSAGWRKRAATKQHGSRFEALQALMDADSWWLLVYPSLRTAPDPHSDLPEGVRVDYLEAADVVESSLRSAAALLRLCVQRLRLVLGGNGRSSNDDIKQLLAGRKIAPIIQKGHGDTVLINGSESVHPGQLSLGDDPELVTSLLAQEAITQPRIVDEVFGRMPEEKHAQVKTCDPTK
jgi:hypothetical protein